MINILIYFPIFLIVRGWFLNGRKIYLASFLAAVTFRVERDWVLILAEFHWSNEVIK